MAIYAEIVQSQAEEIAAYRNMTKNILLRLKYPKNVLVPSGISTEKEILEMIEKMQAKIRRYERSNIKSNESFTDDISM